jgi:hypothetical protein
MNARISLLGTGSAELNPLRAGQSALVQLESPKGVNLNLVYDFGSRVAESNPELALLSHFNGELPNIESLAARAKAAGFRGEVRIGNDLDVFSV